MKAALEVVSEPSTFGRDLVSASDGIGPRARRPTAGEEASIDTARAEPDPLMALT